MVYTAGRFVQGNLIGLEGKVPGFFFPNLSKVEIVGPKILKTFCKKKWEIKKNIFVNFHF